MHNFNVLSLPVFSQCEVSRHAKFLFPNLRFIFSTFKMGFKSQNRNKHPENVTSKHISSLDMEIWPVLENINLCLLHCT